MWNYSPFWGGTWGIPGQMPLFWAPLPGLPLRKGVGELFQQKSTLIYRRRKGEVMENG